MKTVVFVGSNPSEASTTNTAFEPGTKSLNTLLKWVNEANIHGTGIHKYHANLFNGKTPGNRPLNKQETEEGLKQLEAKLYLLNTTHVVALGKTVTNALTKAGIPHLAMPHPSGLNRKLNDPSYVKSVIESLRKYVHE